MKLFACALAVSLASLAMTSSATAAEPTGNVDNATLAAMGLSGLDVMSDEEGQKVRGTFAVAGGFGISRFFGSTQFTFYGASDVGPGVDFAAGGNTSQTGFNSSGALYGPFNVPLGGYTFSAGTYATGSSWAFAGK